MHRVAGSHNKLRNKRNQKSKFHINFRSTEPAPLFRNYSKKKTVFLLLPLIDYSLTTNEVSLLEKINAESMLITLSCFGIALHPLQKRWVMWRWRSTWLGRKRRRSQACQRDSSGHLSTTRALSFHQNMNHFQMTSGEKVAAWIEICKSRCNLPQTEALLQPPCRSRLRKPPTCLRFCWTLFTSQSRCIWRMHARTHKFPPQYAIKHCQRHNGPEGWVLLTKVTLF